jgi:hypothetical protein
MSLLDFLLATNALPCSLLVYQFRRCLTILFMRWISHLAMFRQLGVECEKEMQGEREGRAFALGLAPSHDPSHEQAGQGK